ncbi:Actin-related protein 2/3 complex subunit 5 [Komagataella phaffii CBS 7435]|uniref:Actin-related protein 2/3 complex subunit 5 n=2 Tax=Komagataella phaffii TaxID=460519 RepID=C4R333_KOMPG|nr:Subunit of the ARP2/3 complex [Komagataella phaffii GS115]AOA61908.1 GQ67_01328T0 [Komagataella phaffii]CAH2447530.1 Actin-related protein 2/3 complex subunit 5 [Komagataella phaffii CBS 7435]AOA67199.1 GQ68_00062T0 [Komagataella phaffii GS115]CAY69907.1 Subunit of the ARP2/3 complex [Komagataella phaffii GS115]CCA37725.1 Actin-related protein 2/3 complex subunit 5 [Komagataella phaffii CBS 7435]
MEDWRRIDIDAYDPDFTLRPEELQPAVPEVPTEVVEQKVQQARTLVSQGKAIDALKFLLQDPPYGADSVAKDIYLLQVIETLSSVKQSDISSTIGELDADQQDVLVKYLYKGMGSGEGRKQSGILLNWFDKTIEVAGEGSIVRYLSDKRFV